MYKLPNWELGLLVISVFASVSLAGWFLTRSWTRSFRSQDNEIVGFFMSAVGTVYAVLLAMVAVASWNNYTQTEALVSREASLVGELFRDLEAYPQPSRDALRLRLRDYVNAVIDTEWPALQQGQDDPRAQLSIEAMLDEWLAFSPGNEAQIAAHREALKGLGELLNTRRDRIQTGVSGIMGVLWLVVVLGALVNVGLTYLLRVENRRLHQLLTASLGITFGLVVYLILAMDHPLWGEVSVQPEPFRVVQSMMESHLNPGLHGPKRLLSL
jgi:hypothetical protein